MRELEDEFINHTIDPERSTDQFEVSVCRVVEDEVVPIEGRQTTSAHATSQLLRCVSERFR